MTFNRLIIIVSLLITLSFSSRIKRAPASNDNPASFFKGERYTANIFSIPTTMKLSQPWSGSYWPANKGGIGWRYGAKYLNYNQPSDHLSRYGTSTFSQYIKDNYSPAEKYDFLVGDYSYTLTHAVRYKMGRSAFWEGICHGWSPASFKEKTPMRSVTLYASDGVTPVTFYPDDIKALASQFWASSIGNYKTDTMGINGNSVDNNPASFYIAIGNLVGLRHTPMIYDATLGGAIWNYPAFTYTTTFYNIITNQNSNISGAKISISEAKSSSSYNARVGANNADPKCVYLIGVKMSVQYSNETQPNRGTPFPNQTAGKSYNFFLELDENNNIIGGTWVSNDHPDFIWKIDDIYGIKKDSLDIVNGFGGSSGQLRQMTSIAKKLSLKRQVIYSVMKYLVNNS